MQQAGAEAAVDPRGDGRYFQLDVEDLRRYPLAEMTGCHRPLDKPGEFTVNDIALAKQRCDPGERIRVHTRKCSTPGNTPALIRCSPGELVKEALLVYELVEQVEEAGFVMVADVLYVPQA